MDIVAGTGTAVKTPNRKANPVKAIRKQLSTEPMGDNGRAYILRDGQMVGYLFRAHTQVGSHYVTVLDGKQCGAGRDIPNALDAAATYIWLAQAAFEDAEAQAAAAERADMRMELRQF